ncbi:MAG: DUF4432 family protein [Thaumarchaeota archaeon]|nr:DUF4432 family protein [Nitrososphaerota archaeon]
MALKAPRASLEWQFKGMRTLVLENELVRVVSLLDKGSDIIELVFKPLDVDVMWHSPIGHRNPKSFTPSISTDSSSFSDVYGGGWQDLLPVIGRGPTIHHGATFGLHGETGLISWDVRGVEESVEEASATLGVSGIRFPYKVTKKLTVRRNEAKLYVNETLTNTSRETLEFFWLQHPAYGEPFLAPGCRIDLPEGTAVYPLKEINPNGRLGGKVTEWPKTTTRNGKEVDLSVIPPRNLVAEETTFLKVEKPWYSITNPNIGLGIALRWDAKVHPWLWFWQNYNQKGYPWFGEAWNIALEPSSSFPDTTEKMLKARNYLKLKGRESVESRICVSFHGGRRRVRFVDGDGRVEY